MIEIVRKPNFSKGILIKIIECGSGRYTKESYFNIKRRSTDYIFIEVAEKEIMIRNKDMKIIKNDFFDTNTIVKKVYNKQ